MPDSEKGRSGLRSAPSKEREWSPGGPALDLAELALDGAGGAAARTTRRRGATRRGAARRAAHAAVHGLAQLRQRLLEVLHGATDARGVAALQGRAHRRDLAFRLALEVGGQTIARL